MSAPDPLDQLPGAGLVRQGLRDTQAGRLSIESCLVEIARPRLELSGLLAPAPHRTDAEIQLYRLLGEQTPNPHGRFNSLLRELASLEHALDHRMAKKSPCESSPAEPQGRRESPQGAWASHPPSTDGRDGSPQPSVNQTANENNF